MSNKFLLFLIMNVLILWSINIINKSRNKNLFNTLYYQKLKQKILYETIQKNIQLFLTNLYIFYISTLSINFLDNLHMRYTSSHRLICNVLAFERFFYHWEKSS